MSTGSLTETDREFERQVLAGAAGPDELSVGADRRREAQSRLNEIGVPGTKDEEWRFVRLRPLTSTSFAPSEEAEGEVTEEMVAPWLFSEGDGLRLVFVNGRFDEDLSSTDGFPDSVRWGRLAEAGDDRGLLEESFGEPAEQFEEDYFANLNTAGYRDGAYVVVPEDTSIDGAIHLLHLSTESSEPYVVHPRTFVAVGRHSNVSVVEEYGGPSTGTYFTNAMTEVSVGRGAHVDHVKVQGESIDAFHIGRTAVDLTDQSTYNSKTISYGAAFSRFDVRASGDGEEIDCTLDGLAVLEGEQVSDTHSVMDHRQPNAGSHQLHKMILDDRAHSVFNGKIFVQPHAQKIDAYQLNRTLLLSDRAKVNTKPQLEIFADDVSCTHGATIGQLEDQQLFYLRARGLDEADARDLLIYGFAAEILETIPIDSLRERLAETIARKTRGESEVRPEPGREE